MKKIFFAIAALCLVGTWSCSFDDSDINDRLGDLEDRVTAIESQLEQINSDLQTLDKITDLLNKNGVVSSVEPNATGTGYIVTVTYFDAETPAKTFEIVNGKDGSKGEDGTGSVVGVKLDNTTNRWYWTVDGEPLYDNDGEYLWTSGKGGQDADFNIDGTGNVKLAYMDKTTNGPADTKDNAVDETLYLWVYNSALNQYVNRGTVPSSTKTLVSAKFENGVLTIYQDGEEVFSSEIQANGLAVTLVADDKTVAEHSTVKLTADNETVFVVNVSGASTNYALKASMQNGDGYTVKVKDNNVTVKAEEDAADDKLFIEVLDGNKCYHTWVLLTLNGNVDPEPEPGPGEADYHVTLSLPQTNEYNYLPVAFGEVSYNWLPSTIKLDVVVALDKVATSDLTFKVKANVNTVSNLTLANDGNVTINNGQQYAKLEATFDREGLVHNTSSISFALETLPAGVEYSEESVYCYIANNFKYRYPLTADMISSNYIIDVANMLDGNADTYATNSKNSGDYTGQEWYSDGYTYGYFFDISGLSDVAVLQMRWQNTNDNDTKIYELALGYKADDTASSWNRNLDTFSNVPMGNNNWTAEKNLFPSYAPPSKIEILRVGIKKFKNSSTSSNSVAANGDCRVAEFELLVMY